MQSLKTKIVELRAEMKRDRQRDRNAAGDRIMASLREAFGSELENRTQAMAGRLLAGKDTDADRKLLESLPGDALGLLDITGAQYVTVLAKGFASY